MARRHGGSAGWPGPMPKAKDRKTLREKASMKGPGGIEFSGWWLIALVMALALLTAFIPHAQDLQYRGHP